MKTSRTSAPSAAFALVLAVALAAATAGCGDNIRSGAGGDGGGPDAGWDQVISIDGLEGPVSAYFDPQGILHAQCGSDADCFAVQGYFHAAHRFVQMDLRRRLGRGRLSALAGPVTLPNDRFWRMMMTDREGTPLEERILAAADEPTRAALEAYSRGVNAWLADLAAERNGATLADEYSFQVIDQSAIQDDWEALDSVACILPLIENLNDSSQAEIRMGEVYDQLPADIAQDLFGLRPASPSTIVPLPTVARSGRSARRHDPVGPEVRRRLRSNRELFRRALAEPGRPAPVLQPGGRGSNNWVVSPDHGGGSALLANDPHLTLSHPAIWYLVNLDSKSSGGGTLHAAGASFAGLPGIVLGHNEDIAWGATTTYFDGADVYVEELNEAGDAVVFDGDEVAIQTGSFQIEVSGMEPVTEEYEYVPHHGPILSKTDTSALTVRWIGHDSDTDINFLLGLATATTVDEGRAALENITSAGQNFVIIDRAGDIGWFPYLRLPTRPFASENPPWLPLPGDGSAEWGDPIPYEDLPQVINPPAGFVATANNDMTGALQDGDPTDDGFPFFQGLVDQGYRHERIIERLAAEEQHDLASMQSIQADVRSLIGEALTPEILDAVAEAELDSDAQAVADALAGWDFECPTGLEGTDPEGPAAPDSAASARGCAAFHVLWPRLLQMTFGDELAAEGIQESPFASALVFALLTPGALSQTYWDEVSTGPTENRADIVAAALSSAGAFLRTELGEPTEWLWGRLHTVTLRADLFDAAGVTEFNSDSFANDGGMFTVDVAHPADAADDDYSHPNGPSMRFACEASDATVQCTIELPGGQRHDRNSQFYNSMLDEWLTNQPAPFLFGMDEAAAASVESVRLVPPQ
jgi:penicillin G amidase